MTKKRKIILGVLLLAVAAALLVKPAIHMVVELFEPGQESLNTLFKLKKNEVALVVDDERREEKGYKDGEETYVPADIVSHYMDQRVCVDTTEKTLSYATSKGVITVKAGAGEYMIGKVAKSTKTPILVEKEGTFYVSLSFIREHAACYYRFYESPNRLIVMSDRTSSYAMADITKDTRIRKGPNSKYKYYVEVPEGTRVFVEKDIKQENDYLAVTTKDGISGYVPVDRIENEKQEKWKFEKEPESFQQMSMGGSVCLGWHQVTTESASASLPASANNASVMNVISPTWFSLSDNKGNFTSLANGNYVALAHGEGKKVWGLINDFNKNIKLKKILGVTTNRTRLINNLVASAIQYQLDGINIDFEHVTKDTAPAYLQFLRELTLKCHANDLIVSVDNYPPAGYNSYYDLEEQGRIVDYVILMAYDEHYSGSDESGSVSSLPFVKNGVKNVLAKVPKERVIVALPFYTRLWKEVDGRKTTSEAYGMSGAESVIRANDATSEWDETVGQYYAEFKSEFATYKIWLEEETSLSKKLEVVKKNEVAGVAFWKLGFERAVTWTTIRDALR